MSWQNILKVNFDIGIYNECCNRAKEKAKRLGIHQSIIDQDCLNFRRIIEELFFDKTLDILTEWDECLESKNQPSMGWHFDNEPKQDLQQLYQELKDAMGN